MKWTAEEELKLCKTALALGPQYEFNAEAITAAYPVDHGQEKPTKRAVGDRLNAIRKSAHDLISLQRIKDQNAGNEKSSAKAEMASDEEGGPMTPIPFPPLVKKATTGSKRKRSARAETPVEEESSGDETSSGSEAVVTPTPARRSLRARKSGQTTTPATPTDRDKEVDDGAKDYGSDASDEDWKAE